MKLIIDIPEKLVCEGFERHFTEEEKNILIKAIGNGTPLPKGHGRLIILSEDAIKREQISLRFFLPKLDKLSRFIKCHSGNRRSRRR